MTSQYQERVDNLVAASLLLIEQVQEKYSDTVSVTLEDYTQKVSSDMSGWVLFIRELYLRYGFTAEDQFFAPTAKIEISELVINEGDPRVTLFEWFDRDGNEAGSGGTHIPMTCEEVLQYFSAIAQTGITRIQLDV